MDSEIWLPLATLVLGWAGAQVTEVLRDRRTTIRDRLARRAELQRTTLLELQEALEGVWRGFLASHLDEEDRTGLLVEAYRDWAATSARARLLASRIEDARVRELATELAKADRLVREEPGSVQAYREIQAGYSEAVARIGELLRERY